MEIKVVLNISTDSTAVKLRELFCTFAERPAFNGNPLIETNFNNLLEMLANEAFMRGQQYERTKS